MSVLTRRTYTRVPTPLAAVGYLLAFVAVCLLPNRPLSHKSGIQQMEEELGAEFAALDPDPR